MKKISLYTGFFLFAGCGPVGGTAPVEPPSQSPSRAPRARVGRSGAPRVMLASALGRSLQLDRDDSRRLSEPTARLRPQRKPPAPPLSLTASDGTGLRLVSLTARVAVQGPLAFTELHLVFANPEPRVREGRFSITLPSDAAISRLAMKLPHGWQEAEVVEKQAARQAYEDFLHRRQDPALMEKQAGNQFRARIFPIAASSNKEIKISYSQLLRGAQTAYQLPLRGLPKIDHLKIAAFLERPRQLKLSSSLGGQVMAQRVIRIDKRDFEPSEDFSVPALSDVEGLSNGNLAVIRVTPQITQAVEPIKSLVVLFDSSASRALGFDDQVRLLGNLVKVLVQRHGDFKLRVAAFDQVVAPIFHGAARRFAGAHLDKIRKRRALGASNLYNALGWAKQHQGGRLLIVGDAVATAGLLEPEQLRQAVTELRDGYRRLDLLLVGGIRDQQLAEQLTRSTLPHDGAVLDAELPVDALVGRLSAPTVSGVDVVIAGARWVWPAQLDGLVPGDERLVFAELNAPQAELVVRLDGPLKQRHKVRLAPTARPLLARAAAQAQISHLFDQRARTAPEQDRQRQRLREQIIELSQQHRVLTDYTALLVLETEADYARFNIDRRALSEILTVTDGGLTLLPRKRPIYAVRVTRPAPRTTVSRNKQDLTKEGLKLRSRPAQAVTKVPPPQPDITAVNSPQPTASGKDRLEEEAPTEAPRTEPTTVSVSRPGFRDGHSGTGLLDGEKNRKAQDEQEVSGSVALTPRISSRPGRAEVDRGGVAGRATGAQIGTGASVSSRHGDGAQTVTTGDRSRTPSGPRTNALGNSLARGESERGQRAALRGRRRGQLGALRGGERVRRETERRRRAHRRDRRQIVANPFGGLGVVGHRPAPSGHGAHGPQPHSGDFAAVSSLLKRRQFAAGLRRALAWRDRAPADVLALVALGEALTAAGALSTAARAYGSIIDLYPSRADMRRFAGGRLEALGEIAQQLAADSYAEALKQRPDHPNSHRLLAFALLRLDQPQAALTTLELALKRNYPSGRFRAVEQLLRQDLGVVAAVILSRFPKRREELQQRLAEVGATIATGPSLRFVLSWETDTNDVDLHVYDRNGDHAFYSQPHLASGGQLLADVTTGYGPEGFAIEGEPRGYPYRLSVHYYSRGPMGYGMGKVEAIAHDGHGGLTFRQLPFVIMNDGARVALGRVDLR
ncbi:MAG: hypothetical protein H6707_12965 [Deltaproteobacteria bacterium]|nr:hypothetical protein [Deltaproteobacteria bacterium]